MRILLDECLPAELADYPVGHEVRTVHQEGWKGIENGELLRLATTSFQAFITIDRRLRHQQRIPPMLIVVALRARANRIEVLAPMAPKILAALEEPLPGTSVEVQA